MLLRLVRARFLASAAYPPFQKVPLPALSPTMLEGGLAKWCKREGEAISVGQVLCEVETDKATIDFEFQDDAIVAKHLVSEGAVGIKVGSVIALLVQDAKDVAAFSGATFEEFNSAASQVDAAPLPPPPPPPPAKTALENVLLPKQEQQQAAPAAMPTGDRIVASPLARQIARQLGHDLSRVAGTGPNGRIIASDVRALAPPKAVAPAPVTAAAPAVTVTASEDTRTAWYFNKQTAPHFYLNMEVDFTEALAVRAKLSAEQQVSVNDFILRAAALCMKRVPECNASWLDKESSIRFHHRLDVNVASATSEGATRYPVLRDVHLEGLAGIATKALDEREEDTTFSLINVGAYGVESIVPIVRPGHSCALGVGALRNVVMPAGNAGAAVRTVGTITLSCDHRVVDGAVGAQWLQHFKSLVEKPLTMLL